MNVISPRLSRLPQGARPTPPTEYLAETWRETLANPGISVRSALAQLDRTRLQILLVVDGARRLIGTVTDGDIRRAILAGVELDGSLEPFIFRTPFTTTADADQAKLFEVMMRQELRRVPVLDDRESVIGLRAIEDLANPPALPNVAVLMAGGLGTRLRPLTASTPKPMIPVGNRPLLETTIEHLRLAGIHTVYLAVNYRADLIQRYFGDGHRFGLDIRYLEERDALGTAGALGLLSERPTNPLIVMNGDLLTGINFVDLLAFHDASNAPMTVCLGDHTYQVPYGVAEVRNGQLLRLREKPDTQFLVNAGIYVLAPEMLDFVPSNAPYDMPMLIAEVIAGGKSVSTYKLNDYWVDIGRIEDLQDARARVAE
jgi:dTDP-glucose pyrophosphorylase